MMESPMHPHYRLVIGEALVLAIATETAQSLETQASGNREDMRRYLLTNYAPSEVAIFSHAVEIKSSLPFQTFYDETKCLHSHDEFWSMVSFLEDVVSPDD